MPPAKRSRSALSDTSHFELRYFPLMAKGLGAALIAEHSGLKWSGNATLGFEVSKDWKALKPTTPFGQLPLLTIPDGTTGGPLQIAQTTAIVNYIGRICGSDGGNVSDERYATGQQLIAEAEDIYHLMVKFLPTPYKQLSSGGVVTSKGTAADYESFWAEVLPPHLSALERLLPSEWTFNPKVASKGCSPFLAGELYLFSMLYQASLVTETLFARAPRMGKWFEHLKADHRTERVLSGQSPMGELRQYFLAVGSAKVCSLGDERGRWG